MNLDFHGFYLTFKGGYTLTIRILRQPQSRGGSCVFADGFPAIQPGTARLHPKGTSSRFALRAPRPRWGLAMTNLLTLRHRIRAAKPTACKAVTDRLVQSHSTAGGHWCTAAPRLMCHCE